MSSAELESPWADEDYNRALAHLDALQQQVCS